MKSLCIYAFAAFALAFIVDECEARLLARRGSCGQQRQGLRLLHRCR